MERRDNMKVSCMNFVITCVYLLLSAVSSEVNISSDVDVLCLNYSITLSKTWTKDLYFRQKSNSFIPTEGIWGLILSLLIAENRYRTPINVLVLQTWFSNFFFFFAFWPIFEHFCCIEHTFPQVLSFRLAGLECGSTECSEWLVLVFACTGLFVCKDLQIFSSLDRIIKK